jgi:hypothetical protein
MFQSPVQFLPFFLMGAPLVFALIDLMRTPRSHADRNHSSMAHETVLR